MCRARVQGRKGLILPGLLSLMWVLFTACSEDGAVITDPTPTPRADVPEVPTVDHPAEELPSTSEFRTTESARLGNFSPPVASSPLAVTLNQMSHCLVFRIKPGANCQLVQAGELCDPATLQWRFRNWTQWHDCTMGEEPPAFRPLIDFEGSYYYVSSKPARWAVADVNAELAGGHLAAITTLDENTRIYNALQTWNPIEHVLIGMTDYGYGNNHWIWRSGEPVDWTYWNSGEPNNSGGEDFVHILATNGRWNDTSWNIRYYYLLERPAEFQESEDEFVPVLLLEGSPLYLRGLGDLTVMPHVERRLYWKKVFQVTLGAGATYSQEHSYTHGTSETNGMSFGWSIGVSATADWGMASTTIETEFHQDFHHEITVNEESTFTKLYEATAPQGKTVVFALWQLRERFVFCDENGDDWSDPLYVLEGDLPHRDQGLEQEYLQTLYFDQ